VIEQRRPSFEAAGHAGNIDFYHQIFRKSFASICTPGAGQPGLPTRLVAGLFILKHASKQRPVAEAQPAAQELVAPAAGRGAADPETPNPISRGNRTNGWPRSMISSAPDAADPSDDRLAVSPRRPSALMTRHPIARIAPDRNPISQENWPFSCRLLQNHYFTRPASPAPLAVPQSFTDD
jgi:hypothetical protein